MKTRNNTRGITSPSFEIYYKKPQQSAQYGIGKGIGMHGPMEEKSVESSETDVCLIELSNDKDDTTDHWRKELY